jgi:hypothetical protein
MKKIIYPLALGALLAAPLVFLPHSSMANGPWDNDNNQGQDWYRARDVQGKSEWFERQYGRRPLPGSIPGMPGVPGMPGNSVPLNEGQIFLILAGLGLGAKMLYDRRKNTEKSVV